jgi:hypothetical protein
MTHSSMKTCQFPADLQEEAQIQSQLKGSRSSCIKDLLLPAPCYRLCLSKVLLCSAECRVRIFTKVQIKEAVEDQAESMKRSRCLTGIFGRRMQCFTMSLDCLLLCFRFQQAIRRPVEDVCTPTSLFGYTDRSRSLAPGPAQQASRVSE